MLAIDIYTLSAEILEIILIQKSKDILKVLLKKLVKEIMVIQLGLSGQ